MYMEKTSVPTYKQFLNAVEVVQCGITVLRRPLTTVNKLAGKKFAKAATPISDITRWTTANEKLYVEAVQLTKTASRAKSAGA
jgi:hypothetical protein